MADRIELQQCLVDILGSEEVYYQPPETIKMSYPAIVYNLDDLSFLHANNNKYKEKRRYAITLIDRNPESSFIDDILQLQYCTFDRRYIIDNLNHFIFNIFW